MAVDVIQSAPARVSRNRVAAAMLFFASFALLATAAYLRAAPSGIGTHQQLGLPPCGMLMATHIPCATCGMTTAFSHAAHGHLIDALITQPAGALLALLTAMTLLVSAWAMVTDMSLAPLGAMLWRPRTVFVGGAILIVAWAYKIMVVTGWF